MFACVFQCRGFVLCKFEQIYARMFKMYRPSPSPKIQSLDVALASRLLESGCEVPGSELKV